MERKSGLQTGTKASFAVDRFNHFLKNLNMPVVCIAAVKKRGRVPLNLATMSSALCKKVCFPFALLSCSIAFTYASYAGAEN
jgi:hypothetical protein